MTLSLAKYCTEIAATEVQRIRRNRMHASVPVFVPVRVNVCVALRAYMCVRVCIANHSMQPRSFKEGIFCFLLTIVSHVVT